MARRALRDRALTATGEAKAGEAQRAALRARADARESPAVVERLLRIATDDFRSGRRGARDTITLLGQMLAAARHVVAINDEQSDQAPVEVLSARERTILTLFAEGGNSAGIARKLKISPQTLRNHLHRINRKLRTHTRLEAVTHAQRRGLIA
jgi:DNA-binding CsgD family transcriptional regulator